MKLYNFIIKYRVLFIFITLITALITHFFAGFWPSFVLYLLFVVLLFSHFFFGPIRLIQVYMEANEMEKAKKTLESIKYPRLLFKPIRSVYFTLKGSMAMMDQDYDNAEKHMKKSLDLGLPMKEAEGANKLQLGMLAMQKGNISKAEEYIKQALKDGVPDKESKALAFLQLASIYANKRSFRAAKENFRRAKALNPTTAQTKDQLKQMDKYFSRLPG